MEEKSKPKCRNYRCPNNMYDPEPDENGNVMDIEDATCFNYWCEYPGGHR